MQNASQGLLVLIGKFYNVVSLWMGGSITIQRPLTYKDNALVYFDTVKYLILRIGILYRKAVFSIDKTFRLPHQLTEHTNTIIPPNQPSHGGGELDCFCFVRILLNRSTAIFYFSIKYM